MKQLKQFNQKIIRYIKTILEQQQEDYIQAVTVGNFYSNFYIKYESNGNRNETVAIE